MKRNKHKSQKSKISKNTNMGQGKGPNKAKEPTTEELFHRILYEAPTVPGDDGTTCNYDDIPWADPELIKKGQEFIRNNYFSVSIAHVTALLYGFSFKPLTSVLLRTGGFGLGDKTKSMLRHVETGIHINRWYAENPIEVFKDVQIVRKLHFRALKKSEETPVMLMEDVPNAKEKLEIMEALKKDLDDCVETEEAPRELFTYNPKVFINQYDMTMTQFGFIFMVYLFPKAIGIRDKEGIKAFIHMWAVFGRMLGIQDRYNLALLDNPDLCLKLFYHLGMASLKDMDLTILHLQQTYIDAIAPVFKFMTLKSSFYAGLLCKEALPNFKTNHLYNILSWKDLVYAKMVVISNFLIYHSNLVRKAANFAYRIIAEQNDRSVLEAKKQENLKIRPRPPSALDFTKRIWEFMQLVMTTLQKM